MRFDPAIESHRLLAELGRYLVREATGRGPAGRAEQKNRAHPS